MGFTELNVKNKLWYRSERIANACLVSNSQVRFYTRSFI